MSFAPKLFMELADELEIAYPRTEQKQRTSVSRAYYSVFLAAREELKQAFGWKPKPHGVHEKVWKAFAHGVPEVKPIGRSLKNLKEMRETADYDLDATRMDSLLTESHALAVRISDALSKVPDIKNSCKHPAHM